MRRLWLVWALFACWLLACSSAPYIPVSELPPDDGKSSDYIISTGDTVSVHVFNQEALSMHGRVRSDGKVSVPMIGDVMMEGKSPAKAAKEIEARLKAYVVTPMVTVTVDEVRPTQVVVIGEVAHPGVYTVESSAGVLEALALAGGLTEFASRSNIYVLRHAPVRRIRFTYDGLSRNEGNATAFRLRGGDTVVVE